MRLTRPQPPIRLSMHPDAPVWWFALHGAPGQYATAKVGESLRLLCNGLPWGERDFTDTDDALAYCATKVVLHGEAIPHGERKLARYQSESAVSMILMLSVRPDCGRRPLPRNA